MSKLVSKKIVLLLITAFVIGCESTGTIKGISEGSAVQFEYSQVMFEKSGNLAVTMPDGEKYTGKFVQSSLSNSGNLWEIGESSGDDSFILNDSDTVSSEADAILIGDKGSIMKCKFQFSDPDSGIDGGGIGSCKTSDGTPVNIAF